MSWCLTPSLAVRLSTALIATVLLVRAQSTPAPQSAASGAFAVESQAIAYEAVNELAVKLHELSLPSQNKGTILLGTPSNTTAIAAFLALRSAAGQMTEAYRRLQPQKIKPGERAPQFFGLTGVLGDVVGALPAFTGALTALKGQTTQSSNSFTPVDQVLYTDLERAFGTDHFVVTAYPQQLALAAKTIAALLAPVYTARNEAGAAAGDKWQATLKDLDTQFTALQNSLMTTTGTSVPNAYLGAALLNAIAGTYLASDQAKEDLAGHVDDLVKQKYRVLTVTNDAAGGGVRANTYFLLNLFVPAPHASYNGGAVVSYSLRTNQGEYCNAQTLRYVFGYSKWKEPGLRKRQHETGYANFETTPNRGAWRPIY